MIDIKESNIYVEVRTYLRKKQAKTVNLWKYIKITVYPCVSKCILCPITLSIV